jgi:predicted MPP superfamily phosphohydrolase
MSAFLVFFFLIYGACNFYVFIKAKSALHPGTGAASLLIFFLLVMVATPFIVRASEKTGHEGFASVAAFTGYTWLGLVFLFVSVSFVLDAYRLFLYGAGVLMRTDFSGASVSARYAFFIPLVLAMSLAVYGFFEAKQIRTEHLLIRTAKLPEGRERLRIAQISDIHLGLIVGEDRLRSILREVEKAGPDILVSTGDLVDADICGIKDYAHLLAGVRPLYGKFGVTGNHEFYAGLPQSLECAGKAGITMLRGKAVTLGGIINIAGVDDPAGRFFDSRAPVKEEDLLSRLPAGTFTLLLKHRPLINKESVGLFDLQLSGHTHKGQIFPFSLITKLYYPIHAGLLELANGSRLYVSRGAGTWGPPIRFLCPPEVTIIDLVRDAVPR